MPATVAGTFSLSRLKSIDRYLFAWPPPLWRTVIWPLWFRPFIRRDSINNDFGAFLSGGSSSVSVGRTSLRCPGVTGRKYLGMMISSCLYLLVDGVSGRER